jgi:hypothetical protein
MTFKDDDGDRTTYRGTYRLSGSNVELNIDSGPSNRTAARGTVSLTRDRKSFSRIDLTGAGIRADFRLQFEVGRTPERDYDRIITVTRRGDGFLRVGDDTYDLDQARVTLREDKTAEIRLEGDRTINLKGRWSDLSSNRVRVDITSGIPGSSRDAEATIQLTNNRRSFSRIDISADNRRDRVTGRFTAD